MPNKKNAIISLSVLFFSLSVVVIYSDFDFLKEGTVKKVIVIEKSQNHIERRYREMLDLMENEEYDKAYDYHSPESKQRITKEEFIKNTKEAHMWAVQSGAEFVFDINEITVKDDIGYIDFTASICIKNKCNRTFTQYVKFINIDHEWYHVYGNDNSYCIRDDPYEMPEEFNRALSLIQQRYKNSNNTFDLDFSKFIENVRNCIRVTYAKSDNDIDFAEGAFEYQSSQSLGEYNIIVSPRYNEKDDLMTSILLVHELVHVSQALKSEPVQSKDQCYDYEARAFLYELKYTYTLLNDEERESIFARAEKNPYGSAGLFQAQAIDIGRMMNENSDLLEIAKNHIKKIPAYQKQCGQY